MNASERASYAPTWYTATMVPAAAREPLTYDLDVDVCVVGAGLAGLTAAREIARRGWSVAVLESARVAWNASGRNDGFVLPGFAESMDRIISRVGLDHAKQHQVLADEIGGDQHAFVGERQHQPLGGGRRRSGKQ